MPSAHPYSEIIGIASTYFPAGLLQCGFQLEKCTLEHTSLCAHVQSHEAVPFSVGSSLVFLIAAKEHFPVVECEVRLIHKEIEQPFVVESQLAAIKPH